MLADIINVKPEMSKWQGAIEAYLGNNRYRIIVEPEYYLVTKKLQQMYRYGARVSLPKKVDFLKLDKELPYPSIRSSIDVNYQEKVEGYLKNLNNVFLVDTVEHGHDLQAKGLESITIEGLLQDNDGAIHLKYHSLCCGKLAIEEEKRRTKELLPVQEKVLKRIEEDTRKCQSELDEIVLVIENQKLLAELPEMEQLYRQTLDAKNELLELKEQALSQKRKFKLQKEEISEKRRDIASEKSVFSMLVTQASLKTEELTQKYNELQKQSVRIHLKKEKALAEVKVLGLDNDEIEFISYDVKSSAYRNQDGNLLTSNEIRHILDNLRKEKEKLYDPSVNSEIVRLVEAQEGQVELLIQNLQVLKEDRNELDRKCNDLLFQFRNHIKDIMKDYISEFENLADLLKASAKGKLVEITPEPETWEIHLFIGYDGKEPVAVDGPDLSSGQKASTSLMILLAALSDINNGRSTPIMFLDEPKARVDDERGNEIGQLLQVTDIQYFITHQQGESLKTIDWIDHAFTCSAREPGKQFANPLILKKRANRM